MAKKLGNSSSDVRKATDKGVTDVKKRRDKSEKTVSDLESMIDAFSDLKGGVNQESIESMKKEAQQGFEIQKKEFKKADDDVHKKEEKLEERVETLYEGIKDKDSDAKTVQSLNRSLTTDFGKKFISKIEQDSMKESKDYQQQKKGLETTLKEVKKDMQDQEKRAAKTLKFGF